MKVFSQLFKILLKIKRPIIYREINCNVTIFMSPASSGRIITARAE